MLGGIWGLGGVTSCGRVGCNPGQIGPIHGDPVSNTCGKVFKSASVGFPRRFMYMRPVLHCRGVAYPSRKVITCFPPYMEGFVITGALEPLNLTRRVDGVASAIIGIFIHDENHLAMIGMEKDSTGNNV